MILRLTKLKRYSRGRYKSRWDAFDPNKFIYEFEKTLSKAEACRKCSCSHSTVLRYKKIDPEFAEAYDEVEERLTSHLEYNTIHKAIHGWDEPIHYKGQIFSYKKVYSPHLMMFLLKMRRPKVYNLPEVQNGPTLEEQAKALVVFQRQAMSSMQTNN